MRSQRREAEPIEAIALPDGKPCTRCNGERTRDQVTGGWLPHFRYVHGGWYQFARCCPDCAFGAYRQRCTGQAFYGQFNADIRELGIFWSGLKPGMTLAQGAAAVPFGPLRMRLLTEAQTIEGTERGGWQTYNHPALPIAAGSVGF